MLLDWNFYSFLTSIYSWRLIFKTFHGTYNNKKLQLRNARVSYVMLIPLFY